MFMNGDVHEHYDEACSDDAGQDDNVDEAVLLVNPFLSYLATAVPPVAFLGVLVAIRRVAVAAVVVVVVILVASLLR